jgi:transposase
MRQKSVHAESPSERLVKNIRRATRKRHSSEERIRIVLDGLRGESSIAELCRREAIAESLVRHQRLPTEFWIRLCCAATRLALPIAVDGRSWMIIDRDRASRLQAVVGRGSLIAGLHRCGGRIRVGRS